MAKNYRIAGINFNANFFNSHMRNIFGESFAHSSLSFEKVFKEGKEYARQLEEFKSAENSEYARLLDKGGKEELALLQQRFLEVSQVLKCFGVPEERIEIEPGVFTPCISDFTEFFQGAIRPYRNTQELQRAREEGKLTGAHYETETLIDRTKILFQLVSLKIQADRSAADLKKGNNDAFAYALDLSKLTIPEIININAIVNNESGIHTGFKTSNNDILSASFETCPKELVPIRMQELLHKYYNEWAEELIPYDETIDNDDTKTAHLRAICEREAKFHIEFERIHPFEDGNGRTGRIILNRNLIANQLAPVLITPEMHNMYVSYIDNNDYKKLAELILILSSVSLSEMVSHYRRVRGIKPNQLGISTPAKIKPTVTLKVDKTDEVDNDIEYPDQDIKIYEKKPGK